MTKPRVPHFDKEASERKTAELIGAMTDDAKGHFHKMVQAGLKHGAASLVTEADWKELSVCHDAMPLGGCARLKLDDGTTYAQSCEHFEKLGLRSQAEKILEDWK
jgi:hypothetical protein